MVRFSSRFVLAVALLFPLPIQVCAQSVPPRHPPRPKLLGPADWKPSPQSVSAAYWTLEPGWNTDLEMRNNLRSRELTITPVLRIASGQELSLAPVTVAPQHVVSLNLRNLAQEDARILNYSGSFGSAVFRFSGMSAVNVFAATIVRHEGEPIDFHFDADEAGATYYKMGGLEGVWWLPVRSSTDYLILSNPSEKALSGSLFLSTLSQNRRVPISIGAGQTKRVNIRQALGPSNISAIGGLTLSLPGNESLSATQIVFDEVTGLAAIMKLFDRDPDDKPTNHVLRAPMMALSQPDYGLGFPNGTRLIPHVFLRNAGVTQMQVALTVDWRSETQTGELAPPALTLSPGEVRVVSLMEPQKSGQIPANANWGVVNLSYAGRRADLVAVATSYDQNHRYGLQTPFSENVSQKWAGGMWHVDSTHNTLITTGNAGTEPTTAEVTLFYNGGKRRYRLQKMLPPGQQLWLDVGRLIHDQLPDSDGNTLAPDTMTGSYELRDLDHQTVGQLYEGKLVIDKTYGHAAYGCGTCCGYGIPTLLPDPFGGPAGINNIDEMDSVEQCGGDTVDLADDAYDWNSSNTAVATLPTKTLHTVATGSATGNATVYVQADKPAPRCPMAYYSPEQPVTVCTAPTSETTTLYGTYQITEGSFVMSLNPGTNNYDSHYVTEGDYATGTDSCYWPGASITNPPSVAGSTWTVGANGSAHDQYGVDSIGFTSAGVSYIQQNGAAHDIDFPCVVTFYQQMSYECSANAFYAYADNVLTQTIGSNTVKVCRAGVCTGSIPW